MDQVKEPFATPIQENCRYPSFHVDAFTTNPPIKIAKPGYQGNRHLTTYCEYFYGEKDCICRIEIVPEQFAELDDGKTSILHLQCCRQLPCPCPDRIPITEITGWDFQKRCKASLYRVHLTCIKGAGKHRHRDRM